MKRDIQALLRYAGVSPKHGDFERDQKKRLREMREIDSRLIMKKNAFFVPYN